MRDNTVHVRRGKKTSVKNGNDSACSSCSPYGKRRNIITAGSFAGTGYYRLEPQGSNYSRTFSCRSCVGMVNQGKPLDISVG